MGADHQHVVQGGHWTSDGEETYRVLFNAIRRKFIRAPEMYPFWSTCMH